MLNLLLFSRRMSKIDIITSFKCLGRLYLKRPYGPREFVCLLVCLFCGKVFNNEFDSLIDIASFIFSISSYITFSMSGFSRNLFHLNCQICWHKTVHNIILLICILAFNV